MEKHGLTEGPLYKVLQFRLTQVPARGEIKNENIDIHPYKKPKIDMDVKPKVEADIKIKTEPIEEFNRSIEIITNMNVPARPQLPAPMKGPGSHYSIGGRKCKFCKNNGESKDQFSSHVLRNPNTGQLICPVLRSHICEMCGATGDKAHTRNYCPKVKEDKKNRIAIPVMIKKAGSPYSIKLGERECKFCKNNGETKDQFSSHVLRNPHTGQLICPVLRSQICEMCGATGDQAHTRNYCPKNNFE